MATAKSISEVQPPLGLWYSSCFSASAGVRDRRWEVAADRMAGRAEIPEPLPCQRMLKSAESDDIAEGGEEGRWT